MTTVTSPAPRRLVEVAPSSGRKPRTVDRLRDWEYLERQVHRLICAWSRYFCDWEDIVAVHRQVWEQAQCVRRLRERLTQFPGNEANLDQPVSVRLEALVNQVLMAPTHEDGIDGTWSMLNRALARAYAHYAAAAHPVHDAPTLQLISEILTIKEGHRLWVQQYRRKRSHVTQPAYRQAVEAALAGCGDLLEPLPVHGDAAQPVGLRTSFRLPRYPARPTGSQPRAVIRRYIDADFQTSVEARRLFWCYGYMLEMNLAMEQLRWLYDSHFMPWDFQHDISRHLWDESRHGDSGMSRLLDFGITLQQIGFTSYNPDEPFEGRTPLLSQACQDEPGAIPAAVAAEPLSPADLYHAVYHIGMIAETGHFQVKREAYDDFKAGGDLESAEMMLFDIIDEQTHVQYAHRWLPTLARHAKLDHAHYRERAAAERQQLQENSLRRARECAALPRDPADPGFVLYQQMLDIMRRKQPLTNAEDRTPRSMLPM